MKDPVSLCRKDRDNLKLFFAGRQNAQVRFQRLAALEVHTMKLNDNKHKRRIVQVTRRV